MDERLARMYENRFSRAERESKTRLWECLTENSLQELMGPDSTILDLGCGLCEFINAVRGRKKYGLDLEDTFRELAGKDVEFLKAARGERLPLGDGTCDRVFASNFFEHLSSREEIAFVLTEAHRVLRPGGRLVVIQPNVALVGGAYWDYFDHLIPLTEKSLLEAMEMAGFVPARVVRRFLPFTTKGRSWVSPDLLKIYLAFRPLQWVFGKQSLLVVEKPAR